MANAYELPDDLGTLSDDDIEHHLVAAAREMKKIASADTTDRKNIDALKAHGASIKALEAEQQARITAAAEAAAEIDAIMADTFGPDEGVTEVEASAEVEPAPEVEPEAAPVVEPTQVVTASARRSMNLAAVRAAKAGNGNGLARYLSSNEPGEVTLTAAVDVPGYRPGQTMDSIADIAEGLLRRAQGLKTSGGGTGMVASYEIPFDEALKVKDASSAPEGSNAVAYAADQHRLEGGDLVASGGWCAPSQTLLDVAARDCSDMLWDLPEVQIERGGIRYYQTPLLDVAAMTWTWTEAQDVAAATQPGGPEKPCYTIQCTTPVDVRATAVGVCLRYGILTGRYFPELIQANIRNSIAAHEIRVKTQALTQALAEAEAVTTVASFAAFSAVYGAMALQIADMTERYNLCMGTNVEIAFPLWSRNLFLADIARRQGVRMEDLRPSLIEDAFAALGARVQWVRGFPPQVPADIGGATPATDWPATMQVLMYEAGAFVLGRGPQVDFGVIADSTTLATNDQISFTEEGTLLIDRTGTARAITITVCPNGTAGELTTLACPTA